MITVTVNGKSRTLNGETAVPDLLVLLKVEARLVAIALNGEVVPKRLHGTTVVRDGDEVEIVRMVGGGSASGGRHNPGRQQLARVGDGRLAAHRTRRSRSASLERAPASGADVVIAGAGIIGCAIAYELSRRGMSCIVLDSRRLGMAATNAAAGVLAPLSELQRPDALVRLNVAGLRCYPAWVERLREEVPDVDVEFMINGVLRVAFDNAELAELRAGLRYQREHGMELIELDAAGVREVEPRVSEAVVGGLLCPEDGQVSNQLFTLAVARAAQKRKARIMEHSPVLAFGKVGRRVTTVRTTRDTLSCDHLVLAAGPWTRPLALKLGCDVPTRPLRGQMVALGRMVTPIGRPVWGSRGYVLPRANGLVFAGATVEDVGFRTRTTKRGLTEVRRAAFELVPQLRYAREHFSWAGLRPGSPDGLPIMGPLPGWENVTVATGHFRNGILLGPITGELIARSITERRVPEALAPFDPARFV
jgi:glycine oxidase